MKKIAKLLLVNLLIILAGCKLYNEKDAMKNSLLVMDSNENKLPKSFRTMNDKLKSNVSREGLNKIHASGSGALSEKQLKAVKNKLKDKKVIIVDLRQESHGYIDGHAVSWYGFANAANKGKDHNEICADEKEKLDGISKAAASGKVEVGKVISKSEGVIKNYTPIPLAAKKVQTEEELVKSLGLGYQRFTVRDHARPSDEQIDGYIKLIRDLPEDSWIHVHCRAGKGRTTTFLTIYDMIKNAKNVSQDNIIARQHAIGGSDLLAKSDDKYKQADSDERAEFLVKFYQYAKENNDGFKTSWSDWLKKHS